MIFDQSAGLKQLVRQIRVREQTWQKENQDMPMIYPAPYFSLISVYMARTYEKVPDRKAFLEKMAAAERNAVR